MDIVGLSANGEGILKMMWQLIAKNTEYPALEMPLYGLTSSLDHAQRNLWTLITVSKPILDALIGIVYTDDVSVQRITIERGLPIKGGGCVVMIDRMEEHSASSDANLA